MNYYIDIRVSPNFDDAMLISQLFSCFHHGIVKFGYGDIGISFPEAKKNLGYTLRLHGTFIDLDNFMNTEWLTPLKDYVIPSDICQIPETSEHRIVRRVQVKSNLERLYRRSIKKGRISPEEAQQKIQTSFPQRSSLPYLKVKSLSTGQSFPIFIDQGPSMPAQEKGKFNAYGLSNGATIPWF